MIWCWVFRNKVLYADDIFEPRKSWPLILQEKTRVSLTWTSGVESSLVVIDQVINVGVKPLIIGLIIYSLWSVTSFVITRGCYRLATEADLRRSLPTVQSLQLTNDLRKANVLWNFFEQFTVLILITNCFKFLYVLLNMNRRPIAYEFYGKTISMFNLI